MDDREHRHLEPPINMPELNEEYRVLHTKLRLDMTWADFAKLAMGNQVRMSMCVRLKVVKDPDGKFVDVDTDKVSARIVVAKAGEAIETKQAIFSYDELHEGE